MALGFDPWTAEGARRQRAAAAQPPRQTRLQDAHQAAPPASSPARAPPGSEPAYSPASSRGAAATVAQSTSTPAAGVSRTVGWRGATEQIIAADAWTGEVRAQERRRIIERAERLGLTGPVGDTDAGVGENESATATALRLGVRDRARQTLDPGRLDTALTWFDEFATDSRRAPLFKPFSGLDDADASIYNATTLDMFGEYLRRRGSRLNGRKGSTLRADTIGSYVSAIKSLRTLEAHQRIVDVRTDTVRPAAAKRMRQQDGPPGERVLRRALRATHLRQAVAKGFPRRSKPGAIRWAAAVLAHNLLLRGGELGVVNNDAFDASRDLKIGDIEFCAPCMESAWLPWLVVYVVAIKDTQARHRVVPMVVRRRGAGGALGDDCMDVYDALILAIEARAGRVPPTLGRVQGQEAAQPLFVRPRGGIWRTNETRELAQDIARLIGMDPAEFGAKSFRIGGATDWRAVFGPAGAETIIRERGRWASDVARIYQRALAQDHLSGSAAVGDTEGRELEALCRGWTQPASFR